MYFKGTGYILGSSVSVFQAQSLAGKLKAYHIIFQDTLTFKMCSHFSL